MDNLATTARGLKLLAVMRATDAAVYKHLYPLLMLDEVESLTVIRPGTYRYAPPLPRTEMIEVKDGSGIGRAWRCLREARNLLDTERIDAVLSFNPFPYGWVAHRAAKRGGVPSHVGFIGTDWWRWASRWVTLRSWLGSVDAITCTGSRMRRDMVQAGLSPSAIRILPHAVDVDRMDATPAVSDRFDAIFMGRLVSVKRVELILRAFAYVVAGRPTARLAIAGDGPDAGVLRDLTGRLGLEGHVVFTGWVDDPTPWLKASKLVLMASASEGMPFSLIEGMCCGCVPVSVDVGDVNDHIRHDHNGVIVQPEPRDMALAIEELLADAPRLDALSERARRKREQCGYPAAAAAWKELLRDPLRCDGDR